MVTASRPSPHTWLSALPISKCYKTTSGRSSVFQERLDLYSSRENTFSGHHTTFLTQTTGRASHSCTPVKEPRKDGPGEGTFSKRVYLSPRSKNTCQVLSCTCTPKKRPLPGATGKGSTNSIL